MAHHQISSPVHDRYHGAVKAQELHSQKNGSRMQVAKREEVFGHKQRHNDYDGFKRDNGNDDGKIRDLREVMREKSHMHIKLDSYSKHDGRREPVGRNAHDPHKGHFSYGKPDYHNHGLREIFRGPVPLQSISITKVTVTHSAIFSGFHLGSSEKTGEAQKNFLNAAMSFIEKPSAQSYKALNESMMKLMDPRFAPAATGGAARVQILNVNGAKMAKFSMEVTPAPTKSLDEAREDLKNAMSSKRNGEKGISDIRAEAHANYIRALSEQFKKDGKISHTNHTPTTPVFKSSVIYVVKVTQLNLQKLHELKKPNFQHNVHGKFTMKNQNSFWNNHRHNHRSYVDLMKQDAKKPHITHSEKDFMGNHGAKKSQGHHNSDGHKTEKSGHGNHRPDGHKTEKSGHGNHRPDGHKAEKSGHGNPHKA